MRDKFGALERIRKVADYQLGKGAGDALFPNDVEISYSRRTGRIRHIYLRGKLLATLRPTDGMFSLTVDGGKRLLKGTNPVRLWVKVTIDAAPFISKGRSVFARHVTAADPEIRPKEEVLVLDESEKLLAVGKSILTGREMTVFKKGVAVRVRRGVEED